MGWQNRIAVERKNDHNCNDITLLLYFHPVHAELFSAWPFSGDTDVAKNTFWIIPLPAPATDGSREPAQSGRGYRACALTGSTSDGGCGEA
jgi:hypothetical protein